jgi:integrase
MLSAVTGMRNGEIIALRYQDLGSDCLYVQHSWNKLDGMKPPKNNETRTVEIPFPDLMSGLVDIAKQNPWLTKKNAVTGEVSVSPESFLFWSTTRKKVPMQGQGFGRALREALVKIGFSQEEAAKYDFHGWRHFYTSYMSRILEKKLLKTQTGHKTDAMIDHYSDHETEGDRQLIQAKGRELFAGLIPERAKMLVLKTEPFAEAACS